MPRFRVYGIVSGTKFLGEVEANDAEAAKEQLADEAWVNICHHCSHEIDDPQIVELQAEEVEA